MPTYLVDYDLNAPGKDYEKLIEKIVGLGQGHYHVLKSSWFMYHSTYTATDLYNYLCPVLDKTDRIFVTQVTSNNFGWLDKDAWEWLKKALASQ